MVSSRAEPFTSPENDETTLVRRAGQPAAPGDYLAGAWIGWTIYYGNLAVMAGMLAFWLAITRIAVPYEESALEARFGEMYTRYGTGRFNYEPNRSHSAF